MMELANEQHGFPTKEKLNQNFIAYFEKQLNKREGNSRAAWNNTLTHLKKWCGESVPFTEVDREWLEEFIDYLHSKVSSFIYANIVYLIGIKLYHKFH